MQMHTEKMELHRQLLLLMVHLLCFGHFGVYGRSTFEASPVDSSPSSPVSSQSPNVPASSPVSSQSPNVPASSPVSSQSPNVPASSPVSSQSPNVPASSPVSSQSPNVNPMSARTTYPRTPVRSTPTTMPSAAPSSFPFEMSSVVLTTGPFALLSTPQSPFYTPAKTTPPSWPASVPTQPAVPAPETTLPLALRTIQPTFALTTIPVNSPPSSALQRCQLTFANMFDDLRKTDYDLWTHRTNAQNQLAKLCGVPIDRIINVDIDSTPSGNLVIRFSIEQGYPVFTEQALQNLKTGLGMGSLQLANIQLTSPVAIYWTDSGPCPDEPCLNNGTCDVTLASEYRCSCVDKYTGVRCQDEVRAMPVSAAAPNNALFALLVLLAIPIAIAVVVGFVFGIRRQQKQQLKKAFDLRDVRTIGPRSMLSLPMESGIRNEMYDTRSFALAFSDTTFSKTDQSVTHDDAMSTAAF